MISSVVLVCPAWTQEGEETSIELAEIWGNIVVKAGEKVLLAFFARRDKGRKNWLVTFYFESLPQIMFLNLITVSMLLFLFI